MAGFPKKKKDLLVSLLAGEYPGASSELAFENDYQLVVAVVLSAQCTDKKVNEVTAVLFKKYRSFKKLASAAPEDIEVIIRPVNYYRTKARHIRDLAEAVVVEWGGLLPGTISELMTLPGVGRKTANVVVSERGTEPGLAVDTHVFRVSRRLGIAKGSTPAEVEDELRQSFPQDQWRALHHGLILHGRRVCPARSPKCEQCVLAAICQHASRSSRTSTARL